MLPEPVREPAEHHPGPLLRRGREAVDRGQDHAQMPLGQPPAVAQHHVHAAGLPPPPAPRGEGEARLRPLGGRRAGRLDLRPGMQRPRHVALPVPLGGHVEGDQLTLDGPPGARPDPDADPGRPPLAPARGEQQQRGRGQARELRPPGDRRDEHPGQAQREQPAGMPGGPPPRAQLGAVRALARDNGSFGISRGSFGISGDDISWWPRGLGRGRWPGRSGGWGRSSAWARRPASWPPPHRPRPGGPTARAAA